MNALPTSSLLIATYNWPSALELCLMSVQKQVVQPNEIIIADDGSTHETRAVIEAYKNKFSIPLKHIWHPDEGFRLGHIRNKAMAAASGEYLIQVDGDLILHPFFVEDHLHAARPGHFIGGSRSLLDPELSKELIAKKSLSVSLFKKGVRNKLNALHAPSIARFIELFRKEKGLYNLRGCNMSFWKKDIVAVNGYNEDISGWGREDTELVLRFYNKGLKRMYFKLQGIVYHLYHKEKERDRLVINDEIVKVTADKKLSWCENGINQYL